MIFHKYLLTTALILIVIGSYCQNGSNEILQAKIANYRKKGQFDAALVAFKELEQKNREENDYCNLLKTLIEFAEFYRSLYRNEPALSLIEEADSLSKKHIDCNKHLARLYNRYAAIKSAFNDKDPIIHIKSWQAINLAAKVGDSLTIGQSYNELGRYQNTIDSAIYYYEKAYQVYCRIKDSISMGDAAINLGGSYHFAGRHAEAIFISEKTLKEIGHKLSYGTLATINFNLSQIYAEKKDFKNAYFAHKRYQETLSKSRDQIFSKGLADAETKYNVLAKEEEIKEQKLLIAKEKHQSDLYLGGGVITILLAIATFIIYRNQKSKNKELKRLLDENNLLTKELNHRVKNNFQLIVNIINHELKAEDIEVFSRLTAVGKKIEALSSLHRQLYNNTDKLAVKLKTYIGDITGSFEPIFQSQQVQFNLKTSDIFIGERQASYLGLLITELLTNSLKHAFAQVKNPVIELEVTQKNNEIIISYSDNGKGLDNDVPPAMVGILCRQIKASCEVSSILGFSSKIVIPC